MEINQTTCQHIYGSYNCKHWKVDCSVIELFIYLFDLCLLMSLNPDSHLDERKNSSFVDPSNLFIVFHSLPSFRSVFLYAKCLSYMLYMQVKYGFKICGNSPRSWFLMKNTHIIQVPQYRHAHSVLCVELWWHFPGTLWSKTVWDIYPDPSN